MASSGHRNDHEDLRRQALRSPDDFELMDDSTYDQSSDRGHALAPPETFELTDTGDFDDVNDQEENDTHGTDPPELSIDSDSEDPSSASPSPPRPNAGNQYQIAGPGAEVRRRNLPADEHDDLIPPPSPRPAHLILDCPTSAPGRMSPLPLSSRSSSSSFVSTQCPETPAELLPSGYRTHETPAPDPQCMTMKSLLSSDPSSPFKAPVAPASQEQAGSSRRHLRDARARRNLTGLRPARESTPAPPDDTGGPTSPTPLTLCGRTSMEKGIGEDKSTLEMMFSESSRRREERLENKRAMTEDSRRIAKKLVR